MNPRALLRSLYTRYRISKASSSEDAISNSPEKSSFLLPLKTSRRSCYIRNAASMRSSSREPPLRGNPKQPLL